MIGTKDFNNVLKTPKFSNLDTKVNLSTSNKASLEREKAENTSKLSEKNRGISLLFKDNNISNAQAKVQSAQTSLSDANSQLSQAQSMPETITVDGKEQKNNKKQAAIAQARAAVAQAQAALDAAKEEVEKAENDNKDKQTELEAEIAQLESSIDDIENQITKAEKDEKANQEEKEEDNNVLGQKELDDWLEKTGHDPGFYKEPPKDDLHNDPGFYKEPNDNWYAPIVNNGKLRLNVAISKLPIDSKENGIIKYPDHMEIDGPDGGYKYPDHMEIDGDGCYKYPDHMKIDGPNNIKIDGIDVFPENPKIWRDNIYKFPENWGIDREKIFPEGIIFEGNQNGGGVNGEIDDSRQGQQGDCWLLSGLNSLSYSEKGREIIKNAIKNNEDGTYTVDFKGIDTEVTITKEDIAAARRSGKYSSGDDDVLLMELATERVMDKIRDGEMDDVPEFLEEAAGDGDSSIWAGSLRDIIFLLTGDNTKYAVDEDKMSEMLDELENNPENYAMTTSFDGTENGGSYTVQDVNGKPVELVTNHAWSVKSVSGDTVTIVNPWDSSIEYTIPKSEFLKHAKGVEYYNFDDDHSKEKPKYWQIINNK